jgi:hypothetical protein
VGPAGARREVRVFAAGGGAEAPPLVVSRPGGGADTLALTADPMRPGVFRAGVVPADTGFYGLAIGGSATSSGFRAAAGAPAADGWARLAMLAHDSGGGMVPADSLRSLRRALAPEGGGRGWPLPWLLFGAVLLAAGAEWAIRRLRGAA